LVKLNGVEEKWGATNQGDGGAASRRRGMRKNSKKGEKWNDSDPRQRKEIIGLGLRTVVTWPESGKPLEKGDQNEDAQHPFWSSTEV